MNGIKNFKNGQSVNDLWDHFKRPNERIGVPRERQNRARKKIKENNGWNFSKFDEHYGVVHVKEHTPKYFTIQFLRTHIKRKS